MQRTDIHLGHLRQESYKNGEKKNLGQSLWKANQKKQIILSHYKNMCHLNYSMWSSVFESQCNCMGPNFFFSGHGHHACSACTCQASLDSISTLPPISGLSTCVSPDAHRGRSDLLGTYCHNKAKLPCHTKFDSPGICTHLNEIIVGHKGQVSESKTSHSWAVSVPFPVAFNEQLLWGSISCRIWHS